MSHDDAGGRLGRYVAWTARNERWLHAGIGACALVVAFATAFGGDDVSGTGIGALAYLAVALHFVFRSGAAFRKIEPSGQVALVSGLMIFVGAVVALLDERWPSLWGTTYGLAEPMMLLLVILGGTYLLRALRVQG
ncbi:hypothetical protein [Demequina salsinemoris]|uniref:hypothetical protein n=1 Tax=Demequina salsinemoris TaxID=577470 RepID=UPI000AB3B259|nr:hypothetical protein [Demequina salsinemoris]